MANKVFTNLSDKEIKVYEALLKIKEGTVSQISEASKIKRTTVYNFIDHLVLAGLISEKIINNKRTYLVLSQEKIKEFPHKNIKFGNFMCFLGKRNLKEAILLSLYQNPSKKVDWVIDSKTSTELLGNRFFENYVEKSIAKKINVRVLRSPISKGYHKYHSKEAIIKAGRIVRLGQKTIPFKGTVAIFGECVLMVSDQYGGIGYLISDEVIAETYKSIFNGLWKYSKVLGEGY